ncbi:putative lipoprotein [Collimonas fungivorans]|uniref:Putative lipoprotein n=2 Tax=Collimonas fungivorans TaxID=158899 RepID=A0A127PCJ9_9BURK|nr:putative lipoprotein [Collimonas fungivorans]
MGYCSLKGVLPAICCSIILAGCGGGGDSGGGSSTPPVTTPPVTTPPVTTPPVTTPPVTTPPVTTPPVTTPPVTTPPVTTPPVTAIPDPASYTKLIDMPVGPIAKVQNVLIAADSNGNELNRISNHVSGDIAFRLLAKTQNKGGYVSQLGIAGHNITSRLTTNFEESVIPLSSISQKISGKSYDLSVSPDSWGQRRGEPREVLLITPADGDGYVGMGIWRLAVGQEMSFFGVQVVANSFAFGSETVGQGLNQIRSGDYAGMTAGFPMTKGDSVFFPFSPILAGAIKWTVDVESHKVRASIPGMVAKSMPSFIDTWNDIDSGTSASIASCEATIDIANNTFSCDLTSTSKNDIRGKLSGRFYGPNGEEMGGVLNYYYVSVLGQEERGVTAGFSLKLQ